MNFPSKSIPCFTRETSIIKWISFLLVAIKRLKSLSMYNNHFFLVDSFAVSGGLFGIWVSPIAAAFLWN